MKKNLIKLLYCLSPFLIITILLFYAGKHYSKHSFVTISYNKFLKDVQNRKITNVKIGEKTIIACYSNNECFETQLPSKSDALMETLMKNQVLITALP